MLAVAALALAGCTSEDPEPKEAIVTSTTDSVPVDPAAGVLGTWDEPLPAGTPVTLDNWEVTINEVRAVSDDSLTSDYPPDPGNVHVVAHVSAVRIGPEPSTIAQWDGGFRLGLMANNVQVGENVALLVNDEIDDGLIAPGGEVEGWMPIAADVLADLVDGAVVMIFDDATVRPAAYVAQS